MSGSPRARWRWIWAGWLAAAALILLIAWPRAEWRLLSARLINSQAVEKLGFGGYLVFDLVDTGGRIWRRSQLDDIDPKPYRDFLREHAAQVRNPVGPPPTKQKHVIYLQLESVDGLMLGGIKDGRATMPFLQNLAEENVYFTNAMDNTASGRTTDGEFLVLTSQAPLPRPPVFVSQPLDKIPSLPRVLNEQGYHTASIHGFNGAFWHREIAHTALGYDEMLFKDDLDLTDHIGWGWSDKAVLRAAAEKVIASEKPLFLHVITLTNHHPYYYIAKEQGIEPGTIEEEFLRSVGYLDEAIEIFFDKLAEAGMLDDCLIVNYGDHDSAIDEQLEAHLDHTNPRLVTDTVPVVMVGFNRPATRVDVMAGLQDVPVMVLEELGLEAPLTFLGSGWNRWGRSYSAQNGGWQSVDGALLPWTMPVDPAVLTQLAINYPEKLLEP